MDFYGAGAVFTVLAFISAALLVEAFKGTRLEIGSFVVALFERHKFVRRATIFWMYILVTHAHIVVYGIIQKKGTLDGVLPFFSLTVGLVATLTAWYLQVRYHEDK